MNDLNFVFFHIGDITQPQLLTHSIKKFNPDSKIYFITDFSTKDIQGVDEVVRFDLDKDNLMTSRLEAFANLELYKPAIYIDTDVLVVRPIPAKLFAEKEVFLCNRTFIRDTFFPTSYKNIDFSEYKGKTFGEIYPFLACFTYTKSFEFWSECYKTLLNLDKKFHFWFGDQEALRIVNEKKLFNIGLLDEKIVCNLPEYSRPGDGSYSIHFKGLSRKNLMLQAANFILSEKYVY